MGLLSEVVNVNQRKVSDSLASSCASTVKSLCRLAETVDSSAMPDRAPLGIADGFPVFSVFSR